MSRYNKTNGNLHHRPLLEIFFPHFIKLGNILRSLGRQFLIMTLRPVIISIVLDGSQIDAGSLIQAERNEKTLRRIQKKMMSQSNISCYYFEL